MYGYILKLMLKQAWHICVWNVQIWICLPTQITIQFEGKTMHAQSTILTSYFIRQVCLRKHPSDPEIFFFIFNTYKFQLFMNLNLPLYSVSKKLFPWCFVLIFSLNVLIRHTWNKLYVLIIMNTSFVTYMVNN